MTTGQRPRSYLDLLEVASSLGRADGCLAARFEPAGPVGPPSARCRGRDPTEFARLLWAGGPGDPPSGLEVNAPLWYAAGFAEGLAAERHRIRCRQAPSRAASSRGSPRACEW